MVLVRIYQLDTFSVITLIVAVIAIIFTIVACVYFWNLSGGSLASQGEYTFLFWFGLIVGLIILALTILSLIRIFTYKIEIPESCAIEMGITGTTTVKESIPVVERSITIPSGYNATVGRQSVIDNPTGVPNKATIGYQASTLSNPTVVTSNTLPVTVTGNTLPSLTNATIGYQANPQIKLPPIIKQGNNIVNSADKSVITPTVQRVVASPNNDGYLDQLLPYQG